MNATLYRILRPWHWLRNHPTSAEWDAQLNLLLDEFESVPETIFTTRLGPFVVWTGNYPSAYGYAYAPYRHKLLPYARTADRLRQEIERARTAARAKLIDGARNTK